MTPPSSPPAGAKRVLVNALSVTNTSGAHVLLGHLSGLAAALAGVCRFVVLCREEQRGRFAERLGDAADYVIAPPETARWFRRALWERGGIARRAREVRADAYFTPSGIAARLDLPQIVLCQNPWALVPAARRPRDAPKAWLQRRAYRAAMRDAAVMAFNSAYMRDAYRRNAGHEAAHTLLVPQAAEDSTREAAARASAQGVPRIPGRILCVSAMGPHKNVEAVLRAVRLLRDAAHPAAHLVLAGSWPDPAYARRIRALVEELRLGNAVAFAGFLSREDLDLHYARAQAFCLMSRCESFGIPAIEAQLFGTPVVNSNACAVPEICGGGGLYFDPDDSAGAAGALARLLGDASFWARQSALALANAARFTWPDCTRPLRDWFAAWAAGRPR